VWLTNADINIFTQVGFVVLVGLASKNATSLWSFAKLKRDAGEGRMPSHAGGVPAALAGRS